MSKIICSAQSFLEFGPGLTEIFFWGLRDEYVHSNFRLCLSALSLISLCVEQRCEEILKPWEPRKVWKVSGLLSIQILHGFAKTFENGYFQNFGYCVAPPDLDCFVYGWVEGLGIVSQAGLVPQGFSDLQSFWCVVGAANMRHFALSAVTLSHPYACHCWLVSHLKLRFQ